MLSLPKSPATSQDIILDALKEGDPGGMSIQELSDITGLSEGRLEKRLKGLISSRQVETIRSGRTEKYGIKGARRW
jgi:DNA-binding IclR family transcriptional regulator